MTTRTTTAILATLRAEFLEQSCLELFDEFATEHIEDMVANIEQMMLDGEDLIDAARSIVEGVLEGDC